MESVVSPHQTSTRTSHASLFSPFLLHVVSLLSFPTPHPLTTPLPLFVCLFVLKGKGMSKVNEEIISVLCSSLSQKCFCYCSCFHRKMSRYRHVKCLCFLLHHYASTLLPLISSFLWTSLVTYFTLRWGVEKDLCGHNPPPLFFLCLLFTLVVLAFLFCL